MVQTKIPLLLCLMVSIVGHFLLISGFGLGSRSNGEGVGRRLNSSISVLGIGRAGAHVNASIVGAGVSNSVPFRKSDSSSIPNTVPPLLIEDAPFSLPLIEDYLPASLLTVAPSPIASIDPTPPGLRLEGLVGEAELILLVSSDGAVDEVLTVRSSLPDFLVDYAKSAFARAKFNPGLVNETAVRSRMRISLSPSIPSEKSYEGGRSSLKSPER